jgi:ATP-binding cassette subfamily B protein
MLPGAGKLLEVCSTYDNMNTSGLRFIKQNSRNNCGSACLVMLLEYHGLNYSIQEVDTLVGYSGEFISMGRLAKASTELGVKGYGIRTSYSSLIDDFLVPCIVHWKNSHYIILAPDSDKKFAIIADPSHGMFKIPAERFVVHWTNTGDFSSFGVALVFKKY